MNPAAIMILGTHNHVYFHIDQREKYCSNFSAFAGLDCLRRGATAMTGFVQCVYNNLGQAKIYLRMFCMACTRIGTHKVGIMYNYM